MATYTFSNEGLTADWDDPQNWGFFTISTPGILDIALMTDASTAPANGGDSLWVDGFVANAGYLQIGQGNQLFIANGGTLNLGLSGLLMGDGPLTSTILVGNGTGGTLNIDGLLSPTGFAVDLGYLGATEMYIRGGTVNTGSGDWRIGSGATATVQLVEGGYIFGTGTINIGTATTVGHVAFGGKLGFVAEQSGFVTDTTTFQLNLNGNLTFNTTDNVAHGFTIKGNGTVFKQGNSLIALTGTNTFSGVYDVEGGTLRVGNIGTTGTLGTGLVDLAAGTLLELARTNAHTLGNSIIGAGSVAAVSGTTTLTGSSSYTGTTTIAAGATLEIKGANTGNGNIVDNGQLWLNVANVTYGNAISGSGTVSVYNGLSSAGVTTLTGANSYTGLTTVDTGTLKVGNGGTTGTLGTGAVNIVSGATLAFHHSNTHIVGNNVSGGGNVNIIDSGADLTIFNGNNTYSGTTTIASGAELQINGTIGSGAITDNGILILNRANTSYGNVISGSGQVIVRNGGNAASTTTLTGVNTFSSFSIIETGTLALNGAGSIANSFVGLRNNSTFDISGVTANGVIIRSLDTASGGTGTVKLGGHTLTVANVADELGGGASITNFTGSTNLVDALVLNLAPTLTNFDLSSTEATFTTWTAGQDTITIHGNALDNTIIGSSQSDTINGAGGSDTILAGLGNDNLNGGSGTNALNGGGGTDRAVYAFASSAATITHNTNGTTTIVNAGAGVNDTLTSIERAVFTDKTIQVREDTRSDVNGDGTSDIIWINAANGAANYFQMANSTNAAWSLAGSIGTTWTAVKSGDFTGDGSADIFYRRASDGAIGFLDQNSNGAWGWNGAGLVSSAWAVIATGDFNSDGTADVLYQNSGLGGAIGVLSMTNGVGTWAGMGAVNTAWTASGTGDVNGDGRSDIVFYNQAIGALNALTVSNGVGSWIGVAAVANTWSVGGIGDLNGDGTSDILMYNASLGGALGYFKMTNGVGTWTAIGGVPAVGAAWAVKGMGDYNNDGFCDVLFYNSALGAAGLLTESASGVATWSGLGAINSAWQIL